MFKYALTMLIKVGILVALGAPGFLMRKKKLIPDGTVQGLGNLLIYVAIPFLIFTKFQEVSYSYNILKGILLSFAVAIIFHVLILAVCFIVFKKDKNELKKRAGMMASIFSNCGFLGIPITVLMLPNMPEAIVYAVVFNAVFDYVLFTTGVYISTGDGKYVKMKHALINPITVVLIIVLPLFFLGINLYKVAPEVMSAADMLAGLATPLAMTVMGIRLAEVKLKVIFTSWRMYVASLLRLIVAPAIMLALVELIDLVYNVNTTLIATMIIMAGMPTATITISFADRYMDDSHDASIYALGTTAFSIITIPLLALVVGALI